MPENFEKEVKIIFDYGEAIWKQIWVRCKLKLSKNSRICLVVVWKSSSKEI